MYLWFMFISYICEIIFMKKKKIRQVRLFEKWFEHEGKALEMEIRDYEGYR